MILDARPIVEKKTIELKKRVNELKKKPKLAIIRVGNDAASERYVNNKAKRCKEVGVISEVWHLPEDADEITVAESIKHFNEDDRTTAILLQLPLPKHLNEKYLTGLIKPEKDADGFAVENMGKLVLGEDGNVACTPYGIIELLKHYEIDIAGKDVLIVNRSNIVGKPLAHLFLKENATVTIAHSKTQNLQAKMRNSDIVVTAVGKAGMFRARDFSQDTTIIDVSINFDEAGKMCGDVRKADYDELIEKDCHITPVPNGVGPMTVISLIEQTVKIAEKKEK